MNVVAVTEIWRRTREALLRDFPDIDAETLRDTIDGETGALDLVADLIRSAEEDKAMVAGIKDYITALTKRKDRLADRAAKRKAAAVALMQEIGERKIKRPEFSASIVPGPAGTRITDEASLPSWAWRPQPAVLDTQTIRARLLAGEEVPGAALSNGAEYLRVLT